MNYYIDVPVPPLPERAILDRLERLLLGLLPPRKFPLVSENIFRKLKVSHQNKFFKIILINNY